MKPLEGKIALVAGATRGAGRGIACMLGEAGATVYCTGRSVRGAPPAEGIHAGRKETIEETAEMTAARGGEAVAVRVDHTDAAQVEALVARIGDERGRLDILVNVLGGDTSAEWKPFWKQSLEKGLRWLSQEVFSHIITSRYAAALMVERSKKKKKDGGLIVELTDGDSVGYRGSLFYDMVKLSTIRLAYAMAEELYSHGITALALTPGFMRTEWMLDHFGVTEANWRDALQKPEAKQYGFEGSETPYFVGRAVAALAADPRVLEKSGGVYSSSILSEEYGFMDIDGNRPNWKRYFAENFNEMLNAPPKTGFQWMLSRLPQEGKGQPATGRQRSKGKGQK